MPEPVRVLLCTCPPADVERLATELLSKRLAACVNALPGVASRYWWKESIQCDEESLLLIKTRPDLVPELMETLRRVHPYDVPEILALPVDQGLSDYVAWVQAETRQAPDAPA